MTFKRYDRGDDGPVSYDELSKFYTEATNLAKRRFGTTWATSVRKNAVQPARSSAVMKRPQDQAHRLTQRRPRLPPAGRSIGPKTPHIPRPGCWREPRPGSSRCARCEW